MDTLKNSNNSLLYFSNDFETIGITIKKGHVKMKTKDEDNIKLVGKFITKYDNERIVDFNGIQDKLIIKYKTKNVEGCFSNLDVAHQWGKVFASRQLQAAEKIQMISDSFTVYLITAME